jgi:DNA-binding beta-propeller fold protein YncE
MAIICLTRRIVPLAAFCFALLGLGEPALAEPALIVEARIALPGVSGRIDHMAVDLARKRLFVAELGNGSLDVVDLAVGRQIRRIAGLAEPQGVGYAGNGDLVAVANGGDGLVRFYRGNGLAPAGAVALGSDADDVRIDPRTGDIVVGYGSGGLAIIDPGRRSKIGDIRLAAHPEGFAIAPATGRAFVNVPDAGQVAVVDLVAAGQIGAWAMRDLRANFPIVLDPAGATLATIFRRPPRLVLIDTGTGVPAARLVTCGDADDVFFDPRRRRIYVSCGAGFVDVFEAGATGAYSRLSCIATAPGARTALFVPELDRLYVAARAARFGDDASVIVFRPRP